MWGPKMLSWRKRSALPRVRVSDRSLARVSKMLPVWRGEIRAIDSKMPSVANYNFLPPPPIAPAMPRIRTQKQNPSPPPVPSPLLAQVQAMAAHQSQVKNHFKRTFFFAVVFFFLASPVSYKITQEMVSYFLTNVSLINSEQGCPTGVGVFLHACLFFVVLFLFTS